MDVLEKLLNRIMDDVATIEDVMGTLANRIKYHELCANALSYGLLHVVDHSEDFTAADKEGLKAEREKHRATVNDKHKQWTVLDEARSVLSGYAAEVQDALNIWNCKEED